MISLQQCISEKASKYESLMLAYISILPSYVFINNKPEHGFELQKQATGFAKPLTELIEKSLEEASPHTLAVRSHTMETSVCLDPDCCY